MLEICCIAFTCSQIKHMGPMFDEDRNRYLRTPVTEYRPTTR